MLTLLNRRLYDRKSVDIFNFKSFITICGKESDMK